jgi:hypothetical protein
MNDQNRRAAPRAAPSGSGWLDEACETIAEEPDAIRELFPAAGRRCGRAPLPNPDPDQAGWTLDDAARTTLLSAIPWRGPKLTLLVTDLYRCGDPAEKRGVLRALPRLEIADDDAADLVRDALRTNDSRLVGAALGPCSRLLDDAAWRQGVLKCVFMGIDLSTVYALEDRADTELAQMLTDLAAERRAAGRTLPDDATALLNRRC